MEEDKENKDKAFRASVWQGIQRVDEKKGLYREKYLTELGQDPRPSPLERLRIVDETERKHLPSPWENYLLMFKEMTERKEICSQVLLRELNRALKTMNTFLPSGIFSSSIDMDEQGLLHVRVRNYEYDGKLHTFLPFGAEEGFAARAEARGMTVRWSEPEEEGEKKLPLELILDPEQLEKGKLYDLGMLYKGFCILVNEGAQEERKTARRLEDVLGVRLGFDFKPLRLYGTFPGQMEPGMHGGQGIFLYYTTYGTGLAPTAALKSAIDSATIDGEPIDKGSVRLDVYEGNRMHLYVDTEKLGDKKVAKLAEKCNAINHLVIGKSDALDARWEKMKQDYPGIWSTALGVQR